MYNCEKCNLNYTSRMGLYNHNKQYHQDKIGTKKSPRTNFCIFCNKEFKHNQNKWKHEKICKYKEEYYNNQSKINAKNQKQDFIQIKNEIEQLKRKIETLENKPKNTINNTTNISENTINNSNTNNIINNITVVIPFGKEPINCIPEAEIIKKLEECGINAIIELCKTKHFNPNKPELQNFCVTAKNDPYAIVVDSETKRIKSINKKEVFDKAYYGVVMNIESVKSQKLEVIETKDKIKAVSMSKNMLKHVRIAINEEAYHNKEMVQKTWEKSSFNDISINLDKNIKVDTSQNIKLKTRKEIIIELDKFIKINGILNTKV
jgi:hypothetical protein